MPPFPSLQTIALLPLLLAPPATAPAEHPPAFWRGIVERGFAVPEGESPAALLHELTGQLGSPDPELRDTFAYGIAAAWIYRDRRLSPAELRGLLARWSANLEEGVGEAGSDRVLLRSFSALELSILAGTDNRDSFLTPEEHARLLEAALAYLAAERDLRGFEPRVGWIHATAHTADLLKFLGRSPKLAPGGAARIAGAVEAKLAAAGTPFVWGEDERLARALLSLVRRPDFDPAPFDAWLGRLEAAQAAVWEAPALDPAAYVAVANQKQALRALAVQLAAEAEPPAPVAALRQRLLELLARP
jgi:hypothetical protein